MPYPTNLLDGMVIFSQVVTLGSFTRAAEVTGHSTSHISKEINRLEERLGVRLLNRTTRTLRLTAEGELYFQQSQQIIAEAAEVQNALSGQQLQPTGTLRVSCPPSFAFIRMQRVFSEFLSLYPQVDLDLDLSNRKVDVIADGFDVVVRATSHLEDSSLIHRRIMRSRAITLAAPSYLDTHGTPKTPEDLKHHQCLTYAYLKNPRIWPYKNQYGMEINVEVTSRVSVNSSEMEMSLCLAGHGISRMPEFLITDHIEKGHLVELFTDYQRIPIDVYLIYPSRKHMSAKVRSFIDHVSGKMADGTSPH